jgi:uncharacterized protein involved in high-affinity Fe2+ transport
MQSQIRTHEYELKTYELTNMNSNDLQKYELTNMNSNDLQKYKKNIKKLNKIFEANNFILLRL